MPILTSVTLSLHVECMTESGAAALNSFIEQVEGQENASTSGMGMAGASAAASGSAASSGAGAAATSSGTAGNTAGPRRGAAGAGGSRTGGVGSAKAKAPKKYASAEVMSTTTGPRRGRTQTQIRRCSSMLAVMMRASLWCSAQPALSTSSQRQGSLQHRAVRVVL